MRIAVILLALAFPAWSAIYYVDPTGSDAADGSSGTPWKTLTKAESVAVAGDIVNVRAGEYNEYLTFSGSSGTAANPITFVGERGAAGEFLTILDPSTNMSTGWIAASEVGSGVWKQTNTAFVIRELSIDHKRVAFVYTNGAMTGPIENAYGTGTGLTTGFDFLTLATGAELPLAQDSNREVQFWDGIEALFCTVQTTNTTFLRLRDGSDPNGLNIRVAKNFDAHAEADVAYPAITVDANWITISNFHVRGAFGGIFLSANRVGGQVRSNFVENGYTGIYLHVGSSTNVIAGNAVTTSFYGHTNLGSWGGDDESYDPYIIRGNHYAVSKFLMGVSSTHYYGIRLLSAGTNNLIIGNTVTQTLGTAISVIGGAANLTVNTIIASNTIVGHTSIGIGINEYHTGTKIYANDIRDNNTNIRIQHLDQAGETDRTVYIYRNKFWQNTIVGDQIYFDFYNSSGPETFFPTHWIYNNSFSGAEITLAVSGFANGSGGITNCHILNNIFSGDGAIYLGNVNLNFWTSAVPAYITVFDYNLIAADPVTFPSASDPVWFGIHNIEQTPEEWLNLAGMSFQIEGASRAINTALDVFSGGFTINGITSASALPNDSTTKIGTEWDMGVFEFQTVPVTATPRPGRPKGRPLPQ